MTTLVDYRTEAGLATITLMDPPLNAYTYEMMRELDEAILDARFDNDVHVVIVTGYGDRFFCAGANIKMLSEVDTTFKYYLCLHANETLSRLEQTPKIVIAALNGHTVGGGLEIAMACDLRIARAAGGKIGLPEANLGLLPGTGGTQRLTRLVGKARALQIMAEGTTFDFEKGAELGLVHYVWEAPTREAFLEMVTAYARKLLPPAKASFAVGRMKRSVQSGGEMSLENALSLERELQAELFQSEDATEGLSAYLEKRKPHFRGR